MIRVLVTAFATVPGVTGDTAALTAMVGGLRAELDVVTLKSEYAPHVEKFGSGRMLRVRAGGGGPLEQAEVFARAVRRQLEGQVYDVVHVRSPFEGRLVAAKKAELGFKLVYEPSYFPEAPELEDPWSAAHDTCIEAADLVVLPTEASVRALAEKGFTGRMNVALPGVNVDGFDAGPMPRNDPARLLYLGNFTQDRDLETVLEAVSALSRQQPLTVMLAGDPVRERRERLRALVEEFELNDVVKVRGEVTPKWIATLISASDVCLAPAAATKRFKQHGDLPQPLLEYMACRRAVVVANVPGIADVLDDGTALTYPPGSLVGLTDRITQLLKDAPLARRLGEAAYHHVRRHFSGAARRRHLSELYEQLVPGSQTYDAWKIAFDRDGTIEAPVTGTGVADMFDLGSGEHAGAVTTEMEPSLDMEGLPPLESERSPPPRSMSPRPLRREDSDPNIPKTIYRFHLDSLPPTATERPGDRRIDSDAEPDIRTIEVKPPPVERTPED